MYRLKLFRDVIEMKYLPLKATDRSYYTYNQYLEFKGVKNSINRKIVIYTRVTANNQKDDLQNLVKFLQAFANA